MSGEDRGRSTIEVSESRSVRLASVSPGPRFASSKSAGVRCRSQQRPAGELSACEPGGCGCWRCCWHWHWNGNWNWNWWLRRVKRLAGGRYCRYYLLALYDPINPTLRRDPTANAQRPSTEIQIAVPGTRRDREVAGLPASRLHQWRTLLRSRVRLAGLRVTEERGKKWAIGEIGGGERRRRGVARSC